MIFDIGLCLQENPIFSVSLFYIAAGSSFSSIC